VQRHKPSSVRIALGKLQEIWKRIVPGVTLADVERSDHLVRFCMARARIASKSGLV